jgi:coproporphyrinogen III oxidase-like Fe-S oxidoreductase
MEKTDEDMVQISELFAANVPRYTSYPTAPHFHPGIDRAAYHSWLRQSYRCLPNGGPPYG